MDDPVDRAMDEATGDDLLQVLSRKVAGQPAAMQFIVPYIRMYRAGLSPADRPAGIFMLLGPTGTGKTRTVEALAEALHGDAKRLLKIDCGEYQSDHEVAKLIGAPPGYLGHRETKPMLTSERLLGVTSPACDLALVLFDEIEKAAPALTTLLLGILDRAVLRLGDNTEVGFEKTLIFLTSNLGAREMLREEQPDIGFQRGGRRPLASRGDWRASLWLPCAGGSLQSSSTGSTSSSRISRSTARRSAPFWTITSTSCSVTSIPGSAIARSPSK
jgi:ATP-dependent Clp protease ATP-binding subunit ClpA